jgi:hypothetical protein
MTRRVIQTDLFAAFKESQKRAEEQLGQRKRIHVEGNALRQEAPLARSVVDHGIELIQSPAHSSGSTGSEETRTSSEKTTVVSPEIKTTSRSLNVSDTPSNPSNSRQRLSISYQSTKTPETDTKETSALAPRPTNTSPSPDSVRETSDSNAFLLWIAALIIVAASAYIIGKNTQEETPKKLVYVQGKKTSPQTSLSPVPEKTEKVEDFQKDLSNPKNTQNTSLQKNLESQATDTIKEKPEKKSSPVQALPPTPKPLGKFSVLVCSGISKRQADQLAQWLRAQTTQPVYVRNNAVYAGRFVKAYKKDINDFEKFCKNLEYEGKNQFHDAYQVNFPGAN